MFSNGHWAKRITTVGEAIKELSLLDPELPVHSSFVESVELVVFNRAQEDKHLSFCDGDAGWDSEAQRDLED